MTSYLRRAGAAAATAVCLSGCSAAGEPNPDEVKTAIQDLGGTPESIYQQKVLSKDLATGVYTEQTIFIVPTSDAERFRIVDSTGTTYRDFDDFLRSISPRITQ